MVVGARSNTRTGGPVRVDYAVLIKEIKPWPPSPTLHSLRSVLIHWENGGKNSGSTKSVVPILGSGSGNGDGRIEFNELFRLSLSLQRDLSVKSGNSEAFLKNFLEFNLYEPRRDNIVKGQSIGTAIVDLADYGIIKEPLDIGISVNCKRNFRNMCQPVLHVRIQPVDKSGRHGLPRASSVASVDSESVPTLGNEEYADAAESAFSTDDDEDIRSHSSRMANGALPHRPQQVGNETSSAVTEGSLKESEDVDGPIHSTGDNESEGNSMPEESSFHGDAGNGKSANVACEQDLPAREEISLLMKEGIPADDRLQVLSVEVPLVALEGVENDRLRQDDKDILLYTQSTRTYKASKRKDEKVYPKDTKLSFLEAKVQQMEQKIQTLEGELSEAATVEAALYSVVTEHGGSTNKVHTPARRLSRFYRYASNHLSMSSRINAARSIISGLILAARASGSDVPRLTYWLSNSVMLRAIVSQTILKEKASSSKLESFHSKKGNTTSGKTSEKEDIYEFISGMENVESWIFSRIVESLWWQSITPHMQSSTAKSVGRSVASSSVKKNIKMMGTNEFDQVDISMEIWKRAFRDASERLCPVRGGGHECGCLPVLAKLIMEQLVARLDVAMFNAILRESSDDIPTDPLSDPISDPRVLPIPAGKWSFRAGALLKTAVGNWSRWLTDLFGLDDDEAHEDEENGDDIERLDISSKLFHLLNALSDLMMLPKDMLSDKSIRREVCPLFGGLVIKRVLNNFVPDEFCPDPIPDSLLESLDSEDSSYEGEELVNHHPFKAPTPLYQPPSADSVAVITDDSSGKSELQRSRSSLLDKAHNSDDELDELSSPICSILITGAFSPALSAKPVPLMNSRWSNQHAIRYELLRDIWMNSE